MADLDFDIDLEEDLDCPCDIEDQTCDNGCLFRLKVGPCEAFDRLTGEIDLSLMCTPKTALVHTPNFIRPLREKAWRNSCSKRRVRGMPDTNVDVDFDMSQNDPALRYLLSDCSIAFCLVPRADLYDATLSAAQQTIMVIRGLFIGSDWSLQNDFEECQTTSRNFSADGAVWGIRQWRDNLPTALSANQKRAELFAQSERRMAAA